MWIIFMYFNCLYFYCNLTLFYAAYRRILARRFDKQVVLAAFSCRYAHEPPVESREVPRVADDDAALEHEAYEVLVVRRFD